MSNEADDTHKNRLVQSTDEFSTCPPVSSPDESNLQAEFDPNRSMPAAPLKSPLKKKNVASGRRIEDIDQNLSGSIDFSGGSKPKILHHRVDDLSELEETYEIGKKLGQ